MVDYSSKPERTYHPHKGVDEAKRKLNRDLRKAASRLAYQTDKENREAAKAIQQLRETRDLSRMCA